MPRYPYRISGDTRARLPLRAVEVLEDFVNEGSGLSSFYFHLLSGDTFHAASIADEENLAALGRMLTVIASEFPGDCYGSPQVVREWRGLRARADEDGVDAAVMAREDARVARRRQGEVVEVRVLAGPEVAPGDRKDPN